MYLQEYIYSNRVFKIPYKFKYNFIISRCTLVEWNSLHKTVDRRQTTMTMSTRMVLGMAIAMRMASV